MSEEALRKPVRILMLEDNPLDAELAIARLGKADLAPEVTLTHDRRSFEDALLANPPPSGYDLILAEYALPDFDGIAALALTREKLPYLPFIFISGRVGEEVAIDTLQRGATDYVLKHRLERLVPAVIRALHESEERATRLSAEAMFRQSELRFRQLIDSVPQMVWVADSHGSLLYSNQTWKDNVAEGVPRWCEPRLFHPHDYEIATAAWRRALDRIEPFTVEVRLLRRADQLYRWHLLRVTPLAAQPDTERQRDPGGAPEQSLGQSPDREFHWLGTATDIEDQKLNEEALRTAEKLAVTGRMAAAIAHEINNPLESLTNLLFLVRLESSANQRALTFLDMTENELERISSITKQTLQFYRDPSVPVEIDARAILEEVLRLFATRLKAKGITLTLEAPTGILFQAIKGEIRQVLINLVNNAIDAVQQKGSIAIEAARVERDGPPAVQILVHDNGSGIQPEQQGRLFQPFFSTKGVYGTGLGLWVSKGIVEKHGGTLRLGSSRSDSPDSSDGSAGPDGSDGLTLTDGAGKMDGVPSSETIWTGRTTASVILPLRATPALYPDATPDES